MKLRLADIKKKFIYGKKLLSSHKAIIFVLLALIPLAYLGTIFYLYVWRVPASSLLEETFINSALYQRVMENIEQRELRFEQEQAKTYSDPFR